MAKAAMATAVSSRSGVVSLVAWKAQLPDRCTAINQLTARLMAGSVTGVPLSSSARRTNEVGQMSE